MKKWMKLQLVIILALSLIAAGCSGKPTVENTAEEKPKEKALTIGLTKDVSSFDPHASLNTLTGSVLVNTFDYLVVKDRDGKFKPNLAESWENIDDTTWRFKLRQGVKFHNGDPFTAKDVKFSLERISREKKFTNYRNYKQIKEVKIIDEHTVDIITDGPDPILLNRISRIGAGMLPSKYFQEKGEEEFAKNPVGTGPYKYQEWLRDDRIVLAKNPDYWAGAPKWDKVVFRVIPEESTRTAELMTGGIDIALDVPPSDVKRIEEKEGTHAVQALIKRVLYLVVPTDKGPTKDPNVREAIDLAIDEKAIAESIYQGGAIPTRTITPPDSFASESSLYNQSLYDPARAKELLKQAGYENGLELTVSSANARYLKDKEVAEIVAAMIGEVGIKVNLEILENSKFDEKKDADTFDGLYMNGISSSLNDPASDYGALTSANSKGSSGYSNPEFDKIYSQAATDMNPTSREEGFKKLQQMVAQDRPYIPLFQLKSNYGISDKIIFEPRVDEMLYVEEIKMK
ncbi:ABC transporter substrate-binding protein [Brevibacillus panacihumi]|uniref:ABC transporter substrate-binding protein n=1 Tax=Brevibacillus panacihumi TaxID=497735 RepID=UPI003D1C945D